MAFIRKIVLALLLFLLLSNVICAESEENTETESTTLKIEEDELVPSESKDGKLDIIKRIKKVNPDGSYTIGYEADDGSFKIESRDVLGNIKGTYGFVDDEGNVKRVSYSSSNASEVFTKHEPVSQPELPIQSVVQRIPKNDKAFTTKTPSTYSTYSTTTQSTLTTTPLSVIQSIARRRASSTTVRPNYNTIESIRSTSTSKPHPVVYTPAAPRVLLQRPSLTSTATTKSKILENKSEGQISRPELVSEKTTEHSIFKSLPVKSFNSDKGGTEEASEIRNNILRRQLPQDVRERSFNPKEHVYNIQQSFGNGDVSDVYNNGATATSRPLFTTSRPNKILPLVSSTTASAVAIQRPSVKYAANYQKNYLQEVESNTAEYSQPLEDISTSTETSSTSTNVPVVQIPPNSATPEPLVAIRHPFQQGAILVPLSQLQGRILPVDNMQEVQEARRNYITQDHQSVQQTTPSVEIERQNIKQFNQPALRPLPVHVDQNGFIRQMPDNVPTPYPLPIPITPVPLQSRSIIPMTSSLSRYEENEIEGDIESIQPPVSTREFQMLLNQLIMRQKKLEQVSMLIGNKRNLEYYQPQPQYQQVAHKSQPYFVERTVPKKQHYSSQIQEEQPQQRGSIRQYVAVSPQENEIRPRYTYQYHQREELENDNLQPRRVAKSYERQQPAYVINKRVARLLPSRQSRENQANSLYRQESHVPTNSEEYLPADVREMLLLRMLKLAINPALPLEDEEEAQQTATASTPQYKRAPIRNVEILGEEEDDVPVSKKSYGGRIKRYKDEDMEYME